MRTPPQLRASPSLRPRYGNRLDYRELIRWMLCIIDAPVEQKVDGVNDSALEHITPSTPQLKNPHL